MSWRRAGLVEHWEGEFPEPDDLELVECGMPPALASRKARDAAYLQREASL